MLQMFNNYDQILVSYNTLLGGNNKQKVVNYTTLTRASS